MDIRSLQYWHKLEHFYPYILQKQKHEFIKMHLAGAEDCFPDFLHPQLEPGQVVRHYYFYLGIFKVEPAMAALEEGIRRKMHFGDTGDDESCFCMFCLDPDGTIRTNSFQISSFPWAIHRVRDGKIHIDEWNEDFFQFQKAIFAVLEAREEPVDYAFLQNLRELFAKRINWNIEYSADWLRVDRISGRNRPGLDEAPSGEESADGFGT